MAASYPGGVYSPRTKSNKFGEVYDASKETLIFAEDIIKLDEEIVAIENELGTEPKGTSTDVAEKIKGFKSQADADADAIQIKDGKKVGIDNASPTQILDIKAKIGFSEIGGLLIKLTNKTGGVSVKGEVVETSTITENAVQSTDSDSKEAFGIFLEAGVADGAEAWIVISGIAEVLADANGWSRGDWIQTSNTAKRGEGTAHTPNPTKHFQEIGHAIEDAAANSLGKLVLHFN